MTAGTPIARESTRSGGLTYQDLLTSPSPSHSVDGDNDRDPDELEIMKMSRRVALRVRNWIHPTRRPACAVPPPMAVAVPLLSPMTAHLPPPPLATAVPFEGGPPPMNDMAATLERYEQHWHLLQQQRQIIISELHNLQQQPQGNVTGPPYSSPGTRNQELNWPSAPSTAWNYATAANPPSSVASSPKLVLVKKRSSPSKGPVVAAKLLSEHPAEKDYLRPEGWPPGWITKVFERQSGATRGTRDRYWYSPIRQCKLRSLVEVRRFLDILETNHGDEEVSFQILRGRPVVRRG
jgi:Methyl-CpG binding domain